MLNVKTKLKTSTQQSLTKISYIYTAEGETRLSHINQPMNSRIKHHNGRQRGHVALMLQTPLVTAAKAK